MQNNSFKAKRNKSHPPCIGSSLIVSTCYPITIKVTAGAAMCINYINFWYTVTQAFIHVMLSLCIASYYIAYEKEIISLAVGVFVQRLEDKI